MDCQKVEYNLNLRYTIIQLIEYNEQSTIPEKCSINNDTKSASIPA